LALLFAITLFVSAALLFWVEPLIAKMLLPQLGGTPSVWNTCVLFFQAMLLAGYAYVLVTIKWLGLRRQAILHLALLLLALLYCHIRLSENSAVVVSTHTYPVVWLLGKLLTTVGLPVFVISASAPLLQKWFSSTSHPAASDPYFLYAASNAGSLIALAAFPLLLEPNLRLQKQGLLWAAGYGLFVVLIIACVLRMWTLGSLKNETRRRPSPGGEKAKPKEAITTLRRLRWLVLAFIPSSLVLGVTTYITNDIASTPLLWVIPLSLYLLSYVMAFAKRQFLSQRIVIHILRAAAGVITLILLSGILEPTWLILISHLLFFFFAALVCHNQLAAERPSTFYLTEFYLWMAAGGVLGGVFNALLAPLFFNTVFEYPLVIVLACAMLPRVMTLPANGNKASGRHWQFDLLNPLGIGLLTAGLVILATRSGMGKTQAIAVGLGVPLTINYLSARRPLRFALGIAAIMAGSFFSASTGHTLYAERNFYGTLRIVDDPSGPSHMLYHGRTMHGWQFTDDERRCEPLSYYHRTGPLGSLFEAFNAHPASTNVAVVGLGAGGMIPYARVGQEWTYFEINPAVVRIAQNRAFFTYLQDCAAAPVEIILGDARLQIRNAPDASYGLIVLDAFSSDAIPVHLLTSEALNLYLSKLADKGLLVIHISNRSLNLRPVVGDLSQHSKLIALVFDDRNYDVPNGKAASEWVVLARHLNDLGSLLKDRRWHPLRARSHPKVWTDDFSDIQLVDTSESRTVFLPR
jgi:spermidine synthase